MIHLRSLLREGRIPSISEINDDVKRKMAAAAQVVYDEWKQDEEGEDLQYGCGGICDNIAQAIADQLPGYGKMQTQYSEPHTYVIAQFKEGIFTIDIPYDVYETGDLYTWKKKSDVKFDPLHIVIYKLDPNSRNWKKYTEYD
jgi:hypothetical protein